MRKKSAVNEPLSIALKRYPNSSREEINSTVRWIGLSALSVFAVLIVSNLLAKLYLNVIVMSIGIIPILISLKLLDQGKVVTPSTILAVTIIILITWMATVGQGIYDIGILGYPVILIVAGLFLRGRVLIYLSLLTILCMGWLVFGDIFNLYQPFLPTQTSPEYFFIGSIIILIAGNTIYRLSRNVFGNLIRAEQEIEMREQAEREGEILIHQLKQKNQELDRFAIRVSHDLKTPLITLAGFLGYMEKDINNGDMERAKKDFAQINDAAKQMGKFVDELLDLSRVGRITNPPIDVPFEDVLQDSLKAADGLLKEKQVQVQIDAIFPLVHVDRMRIVQVMQNLITNAVKFMGDQSKPVIKIGFDEVGGEHIFYVSDNGIGIALENHERIFELFNKLDPETEGTGLGLGLVKKIIEIHGGRIWVESEVGKGSIFRFTLSNQRPTSTNT